MNDFGYPILGNPIINNYNLEMFLNEFHHIAIQDVGFLSRGALSHHGCFGCCNTTVSSGHADLDDLGYPHDLGFHIILQHTTNVYQYPPTPADARGSA